MDSLMMSRGGSPRRRRCSQPVALLDGDRALCPLLSAIRSGKAYMLGSNGVRYTSCGNRAEEALSNNGLQYQNRATWDDEEQHQTASRLQDEHACLLRCHGNEWSIGVGTMHLYVS
ncbi:hypothetical protein HID58_067368 [Brassica napus]|uniref:Uncharacterized protein n=1 Tax=Brassica napus TaxID=3708 RepID=A0ABQ7ZIB0_BRANA|nr:hypothetical protein HID58_067368 [Brassica napus]